MVSILRWMLILTCSLYISPLRSSLVSTAFADPEDGANTTTGTGGTEGTGTSGGGGAGGGGSGAGGVLQGIGAIQQLGGQAASMSAQQGDSDTALKIQMANFAMSAGLYTAISGYDFAALCGREPAGVLFNIDPCVEGGIAAALAAMTLYMMSLANKTRKKQAAETGQATTGPAGAKCSPEENLACEKMKKYTKVTKSKCECKPANMLVDMKGNITNPELADKIPDDLQEAIKTAVQTNDASGLEDFAPGIGDFAATEPGGLEAAVQAAGIELPEGEGGEEEEEEEDVSVAFGGDGVSGAPAGGYITDKTKLDPVAKRFKDKDKKKKEKKKKPKKESGIIPDENRGIFVVVSRRYDSIETQELDPYLRQQAGKYIEIKYIPDEKVVKEAVEKTKIRQEKTSTLGEEIQRFEEQGP